MPKSLRRIFWFMVHLVFLVLCLGVRGPTEVLALPITY